MGAIRLRTINLKTFSATRHKAGQGVATRALIKHFLLELQPFVWQLKHDLRGP